MISLLWPLGQDSALSERRDGEDTDPCEYPGLYCAVQSLYSHCTHCTATDRCPLDLDGCLTLAQTRSSHHNTHVKIKTSTFESFSFDSKDPWFARNSFSYNNNVCQTLKIVHKKYNHAKMNQVFATQFTPHHRLCMLCVRALMFVWVCPTFL